MNYDFLKYLKQSELEEFEQILSGKCSSQELLSEIKKQQKTEFVNPITGYSHFSATSIPNYSEKLEEKCQCLMQQINFYSMFFLIRSFTDGIAYGGVGNFFEPEMQRKIQEVYQIPVEEFHTAVGSCWYYKNFKPFPNADISLDKVDKFLTAEKFYHSENPVNTLNYFKNYLYTLLKENPNISLADIEPNYAKKRELVIIRLADISSYLLEIRKGTNLRLSVGNAGLSRTAKKTTSQITYNQDAYIDALVYGTTYEKLENRDYTDYQKLLYLPTGKDYLKR